MLRERDTVRERVAVGDALPVALLELVRLEVDDSDALAVREGELERLRLVDRLCDREDVTEAVDDPLRLDDAVPEGLRLMVTVWLPESVPDTDELVVWLPVCVRVAVAEDDGVGAPLLDCDALAYCVLLGVLDCVRVPVVLGVRVTVIVNEAVTLVLGVPEVVTEGDPVPDGEPEPEREPDAVREPVGLRVPEREAEPDRVTLVEAVALCVGVPERVTCPLRVPDALGLDDPLAELLRV